MKFLSIIVFASSLCLGQSAGFSAEKTTITCPSISTNPKVNTIFEYTFKALDEEGKPFLQDSLPGVKVTSSLISYSNNYEGAPSAANVASLLYDSVAKDGTYRVQLITTVAGTYMIKLTLDGVAIGPTCAVTFQPEALNSLTFTAATRGTLKNPLVVGIKKVFSLIANDKYGNPVPLKASDFNPPSFSVVRDFFASKTVINANEKDINIVNAGDGELVNLELTPYVTGKGTMALSMIGKTVTPFSGASDNIFTILAGEVSVAQTTADWSVISSPKTTESTSGLLYVTVRDAWGNQIKASKDQRIPFVAKFSLVPNSASSAGSVADNVYEYRSAYNEKSPNREVIAFGPISKAGFYKVSVTWLNNEIKESPYQTFSVLPDVIWGTFSEFQDLPSDSLYKAGDINTLVLVGKDRYGNKRINGDGFEYVRIDISKVDVANGGALSTTILPVTDNKDGTFSTTFSYPTSGNYTIHGSVFGVPVMNSGARALIWAETSATKSEANGDGLKQCKEGIVCRFTVAIKDIYGNPSYNALKDKLTVSFLEGSSGKSNVDFITKYQGFGVYSVEYTGVTSGNHVLSIKINDEALGGGPYVVKVVMSDVTIGIIGGGVAGIVMLAATTGLVFYKDYQLRLKKQQWELRKQKIYEEYNQGNEANNLVPPRFPLSNAAESEENWQRSQENLRAKTAAENIPREDSAQLEDWTRSHIKKSGKQETERLIRK